MTKIRGRGGKETPTHSLIATKIQDKVTFMMMLFLSWPEQHKMRSQLTAQFMPFFRLIARILTFRDRKYRILTFCDKKFRILTFCDKTELYLTVLQQNNVEACSLWLSLALSGSLWLPLARSCSLRLPIALRICVQHPRSAHKALAQLAAALLRCNTFCCSVRIIGIL